jgi:four helix bundle protein
MSNANTNSKAFDIEERLIAFAGEIILYSSKIKRDFTSEYYTKQMIRSSGSAALNFGELQGSITTKDFIFKASLSIKELKETRMSLKILKYVGSYNNEIIDNILGELEQLIAIISKIIINKRNAE